MAYTARAFEMIKKTQWVRRSGRWKHLDESSFASLLIRSSAGREGRELPTSLPRAPRGGGGGVAGAWRRRRRRTDDAGGIDVEEDRVLPQHAAQHARADRAGEAAGALVREGPRGEVREDAEDEDEVRLVARLAELREGHRAVGDAVEQ